VTRARTALALLAIVVLGAGLRAHVVANPSDLYQSADELSYGKLAIALATHHRYGDRESHLKDPLHWPPGAPFMFAVARQVHPEPGHELLYDIRPAYWAQALVGTAAILVAFLLAAGIAGPVAGLIAAFALAVNPGSVLATGDMLSEPLGALLLALGLLALAGGLRRGGAWRHVLAGVLLGLAILTRADYLLLVPLLALLALVVGWRRAGRARTGAALGAALVAGGLVPVAPWTIYASGRADAFVPVTQGGAAALFVGTYLPGGGTTVGMKHALGDETRAYNPKLHRVFDYELEAGSVLNAVAARHRGISRDAALRTESLHNLRHYALGDPLGFARMMLEKVGRMWKRYSRGGARPTLTSLLVLHLAIVVFSALALLAGMASRGRRDPLLVALALTVLYGTGLHTLVVSQPRYALPLMPLLAAAGAAGGVLAARAYAERRRYRTASSPVSASVAPK
jgi:4-amino-4-deoxy-L-arabinose transferase-like glycosyltransferase